MNSQCTHLLSPALSPHLSSSFPHMWKLWRLPGSQASAVGKAPRTGAWTTQVVRRLRWNVGESEAGPHCCMGCPIRGRGIFGAMREMQTDSLRGPGNMGWGWGWPLITRFLLGRFSLKVVHSANIISLRASRICQAEVREAQEKSREEVERIKLLRWDASNTRWWTRGNFAE